MMQEQYQTHHCKAHSKYESVMQNVTSSSDFEGSGEFIENMQSVCVLLAASSLLCLVTEDRRVYCQVL